MADRTARPAQWLLVALVSSLALNVLVFGALRLRGHPPDEAMMSTAVGHSSHLWSGTGADSWRPMARAHKRYQDRPEHDVYGIFFEDRVKFHYPPSALLLLDLFPEGPNYVARVIKSRWLVVASWLAMVATIGLSALILQRGVRSLDTLEQPDAVDTLALALTAGVLGLTFYPLAKSYSLGQIQVILGCLVALALYAYVMDRRGLAGACLALCSLVKPQYGLVFLMMAVRRDWRFVGGFAVFGVLGLGGSLVRFGFENHLRYLDVMSFIARRGEAYWPNQSMNGLLNRFLENGVATKFDPNGFAPYHPVVYYGTLATSAVIVALALWRPGRRRVRYEPLDLAIAVAAATLASPVAWEHHYGSFLALYALGLPIVMRVRPAGAATGCLLGVSYVTVANVMLDSQLLLRNKWLGLTASHLFFGAMLFFLLLVWARARQGTELR